MLYDPQWKAPVQTNKFLSGKKLNITAAHRDALIKTLEVMESGGIEWGPPDLGLLSVPKKAATGKYLFNMDRWPVTSLENCGTVACIGGNAEFITGVDFEYYRPHDGGELRKLFYPHASTVSWHTITVKQGAKALRNYLTTGKSMWDTVS